MNARTIFTGAALALVISIAAWRARALSAGGAAAAAATGALAFAAGWSWAGLLVAFFLSSTLLGRVGARRRDALVAGRIEKGGRRDAVQVLANGGVFAAAAAGALVQPHVIWQQLGAAALAASTADTWATEIGTLARQRPRSILGGRVVDVGTSGAVTLAGSLAGVAGAAFIAAVAAAGDWPARTVLAALLGGIAGCFADSLLGASLQARRWCASCRMATEMPVHTCGARTEVVGGCRWLDNDGVNALSSLIGGVAGAGVTVLG